MHIEHRKARERAVKLLNSRKPEHPPDIYYIRRNEELFDRYIDQEAITALKNEATPRL